MNCSTELSMVHNFGEAAFNLITLENLNRYRYFVNELHNKVNTLEQQVQEVEQFFQFTDVQHNDGKNKGREKPHTGSKKPMQRVSGREATALEEMQEDIMRPFTKILNEITQHKWAWPFKEPVDVEGLQLHDYYEIIEKPMDFSTIKRKMEAKDGSGYKNVREIYADVRLIFKNAMRYNDEKNDIHVMAKTLLEKFEKKWLLLLPKIAKAESELSKEEAHEQLDKKLAQEATYGSMTRDLSTELSKVDMDLKNLKAVVTGQCRKLSRPEKFILVKGIPKLSPDNLLHALKIINESDPNFKHSTQMVTLDLDSQSDYTVWRLHMYVKKTLEVQATTEGITVTTHEESIEDKKNNSKRRRIG